MTAAPRGVLLDLDGVLVDSHVVVERHWRRWSAANAIDPRPLLAAMPGVRSEEVMARFGPPGIDVVAEARAMEEAEADDLDGLVAGAGAAELLGALDAAGIPWGVVTSGMRRMATNRLVGAGLPVPATFVTAEDVAAGKPDPAPYRRGAELLGVPAEACAVVEDAPAGIAAGRAAGARVIALTTTFPAAALAAADVVVASLGAARPHLL